ncbi:MAG: T9SS type A sorting domain-containing protein, partial [Saprospiraceae bacterium]
QAQEVVFNHNNGDFILGFENGKLGLFNTNLQMNDPFPVNVWKHVALNISNDGQVGTLIVDGVTVANEVPLTSSNIYFNKRNSFGSTGNYAGFKGNLDEIRIWNDSRTLTQINEAMNCRLTGEEEQLALYLNFDEAIPYGDNSLLDTPSDLSPNAYLNKLIDFELAGTASNFISDDLIFTNTCGIPALAVEWLKFTAQAIDNQFVNLNWQVAYENATTHYEIERSANGKTFESIDKIAANGNLNYQFLDKNPLRGDSYYRIVEVATDGSISYSTIEQVQVMNKPKLTIYPNPTNGKVQIQGVDNLTSIKILDAYGRVIATPISGSTELDLSAQPAGIYWIAVQTETQQWMEKVVVQR